MSEVRAGIRLGIPIAIGYMPIAVTFGVLGKQTGLSPLEATGMSALVFAGASQFIALSLVQAGVSYAEIILATFILNLRHLLMSTSLAGFLSYQRWQSPFLSFGITDETFVVATLASDRLSASKFLGLIFTAYFGWVLGTLLGSLFASFIPEILANAMGIALYAMFIGLLVPSIKKSYRTGVVAGLSALIAWILYVSFPGISYGWIIVLATLAAASLGIWLEEEAA